MTIAPTSRVNRTRAPLADTAMFSDALLALKSSRSMPA